jgi:hypothetical protein
MAREQGCFLVDDLESIFLAKVQCEAGNKISFSDFSRQGKAPFQNDAREGEEAPIATKVGNRRRRRTQPLL